ncbi:MAG: hypothetical protein ACT4UQ_04295 [Gammaproteobacteria bacterium]
MAAEPQGRRHLTPACRAAHHMTSARATACLTFTLGGVLAVSATVAGPPSETAPIEFSVLTPAMEGRYVVASEIDLTAFVPPYLALGHLGKGRRSEQLRALVARERYKPERTIADRLIDRLGDASYPAVHEPIQRKPAGSVQSLSWDDLPERPRGKLILDLTIRWICLCSDVAFTKFYPAISLNWRLLDPARRSVVIPTRTLSYFHYPPSDRRGKSKPSTDTGAEPAPEYPVENVSDPCGFGSVKDAEANPAVLWGCFGEAYDAALRRLVIDLKKAHPPPTTPD